jgi:DNA-binding NarL/FixJ family response regulator
VMLASAVDEAAFFAALRLGAAGYLLKDVDAARLAADVAAVAAGKAALSPEFAVYLLEAFRSRRRVPGLTRREAEVLSLLARDLTTKQVALQLGISPATVRRHVSSAVERLGVADRHEAIARFAFRGSERE